MVVSAALAYGSSPSAANRAAAEPAAVGLRALVGQRLVVAMAGTSPSPQLLARVRAGEVGGVILFGGNVVSQAQLSGLTSTLQRAARDGGRPPLLIATDQEGGAVRRLPWVGPRLPPSSLGRLSAARVRSEAARAGAGLRLAGVNLDLAPVADVPGPGSFMALEQRTLASTPASVSRAATAFAQGLATARVAAAVKHFPGIGRATRNTDRAAVAISTPKATLSSSDLLPFRAAVAAGVPLVMISNATYPALDAKPATWSPQVQGLLRHELGFDGVTISDALDGAAATRGRSLSSVATLAAQAGVDLLLLTGSEASTDAVFEHLVAAAVDGRLPRPALEASYDRILALKRAYG